MKSVGRLILVNLAVLGVFLLVAEVGIRVYTHFAIFYDIEMSRYANELKVPAASPVGHVHRPGATAHLMGVDVEINSDGFRDAEYSLERTESRRIIFLGDSLTFAWGVEKPDAFETLLEAALSEHRSTEIINLGTGNYNTVQEVNLFLTKGLKYAPDMVVVFYFINDAEPTPTRSTWGFLGRSRIVTFFWSRVHAALTNIRAGQSFLEYYSALYTDDQSGWIDAQKALLELKAVCQSKDIELRVVLLPELHELVDYPLADQHAKIQGFLDASHIASIDLAPFFTSEEDPHRLWVALDDAHPNAYAHALIAQYTLDFISGETADE